MKIKYETLNKILTQFYSLEGVILYDARNRIERKESTKKIAFPFEGAGILCEAAYDVKLDRIISIRFPVEPKKKKVMGREVYKYLTIELCVISDI